MVVAGLNEIVKDIKVEFRLSEGDVPDLELFADKLMAYSDWKIFPARVDRN